VLAIDGDGSIDLEEAGDAAVVAVDADQRTRIEDEVHARFRDPSTAT
jgi:hypothetical protein